MNEDVADQGSHEHEGGRFRIGDADDAGAPGAAEVVGDDAQASARRAVVRSWLEWKDDGPPRPFVLRDGDVLRDGLFGERHPLLGQAAEDDAGIGGGVDALQVDDALRKCDGGAHGLVEEALLRCHVAEEGGRRDLELAGDVGQGRGRVALEGEDAAGGLQDLVAGDAGRPAHL